MGGSSPSRRIAYLSLQATRQGQASYAHVHEIIRGLERRGWHIELFQPWYADAAQPPGALGRLVEFAFVQWRYLRAASGVDVLYVRAHFAALPVSVWAALRRLRTVQELNGVYEDAFIAWPRLRVFRPLIIGAQRMQLRTATLVIAVTDGLRGWVVKEARHGRVAVVPNGANTEVFTVDGPVAPGLPMRYVAFVGTMAAWQGVETMLHATRHRSWPDGVALVIVGDGASAPEVERAAGSEDRVIYLGRLPYRDVPAVLRGAVATLSVQSAMPRTLAGGVNPLKVFEALACGVPVIVTDHAGQADLVRAEKCGWIVPPGDAAAVARAVSEAVADPARSAEMGRRGRAAVVREHSWDARAGATHALLLEILKGPTG